MDADTRIEGFLDQATAGLRDDPELKLDVRAELLSHLQTSIEDGEAEGLPAEEAIERAFASVGPVTDIAGDLVSGNRRRMRMRARVRSALRFLLVPAAVLVALFTISFPALEAVRQMGQLTDGPGSAVLRLIPDSSRPFRWVPELTQQQRLVLKGDPSRETQAEQQRAIWESEPDNVVYFNNYLTHLLPAATRPDATQDNVTAFLDACRQGLELEPDNARYHYLMAAVSLEQACEVESVQVGEGDDGKAVHDYKLTIHDRAEFDEAMGELCRGTSKPYYHRYSNDMLLERLGILGEPKSLLVQIEMISMAAGVLLPDLSHYRNGMRVVCAYARMLADDGRKAEAVELMSWWEPYVLHLAEDSFTLIDMLVVEALLSAVRDRLPAVYRDVGMPDRAEAVAARAQGLAAPMVRWRDERKQFTESQKDAEFGRLLKRSGGALTAMLLPALGRSVDAEALAPSRWLEYVVAENMVRAVLTLGLLAGMVVATAIAVRWRFAGGGAAIPILLVPDWRETGRAIGLGIVLPLVVFYVLTRWLPLGGRGVALHYCWLRFALQVDVLLCVMGYVTTGLMAQSCARRCRELGVSCPGSGWPSRWEALVGVTAVLALAFCVWLFAGPKDWSVGGAVAALLLMFLGYVVCLKASDNAWRQRRPRQRRPVTFAVVCGLLLLLSVLPSELLRTHVLLALAPAALFWFLVVLVVWPLAKASSFVAGRSEYGLYYGSVARSLLPGLALTLIVLNVLAYPYLTRSEAALIASDRVIGCDRELGGFTKVETALVRELRDEMLKATRSGH